MFFRGPALMNLVTKRLVLRPMAQSDAPALFAILRDPEAMRFWDRPPVSRLAVVEEMVREQLDAMARGQCRYWTVWKGGDAIGGVDLSFILDGEAQFGFLFHRDHWGQGYAAESLGAVITHAFAQMNLHRLVARIHAGNRAAAKALEKNGFVLEEMRPGYRLDSGATATCEFYARLRPRNASQTKKGA